MTMKKMRNLLLVFMATLILVVSPLSVSATDVGTGYSIEDPYGVAPCLENCEQASFTFLAEDGYAHFGVSFVGKSETFSYAKLTVKIQKKYLLLFWQTVEIDEPYNEWVRFHTDIEGIFQDSFPITETGTYRAVFTLEVTGTDGSTDVIEEALECDYN